MRKRLLIWVLFGAAFFVGIQYILAFFYASEFDDFVKDEVKMVTPLLTLGGESVNSSLRARVTT